MGLSDATAECAAKGYAGFTYEPAMQRVWFLEIVEIASCADRFGAQYDVYVLQAPTTGIAITTTTTTSLWSAGQFMQYPHKNCYNGFGGINVGDYQNMGLSDATAECAAKGYAGFTYEPAMQRVWFLER